jgi:hypothetical protein
MEPISCVVETLECQNEVDDTSNKYSTGAVKIGHTVLRHAKSMDCLRNLVQLEKSKKQIPRKLAVGVPKTASDSAITKSDELIYPRQALEKWGVRIP